MAKRNPQRRIEIISYIVAFKLVHQYSPSVREIGQAIGITSTSTVHGHLERMRRDGLIETNANNPRTLRVTGEALKQFVCSEQVRKWACELR